jgi:hypothetical protein
LATISVQLVPSSSIVQAGDSFTVDIVASITPDSAIVGWGIDLDFDANALSHDSSTDVTLGGNFAPLPAGGDGDMLAGLVLPPNVPVFDNAVLLASLSFYANAIGDTAVVSGYTPSDAFEGFSMPGGQFANAEFGTTVVTVVPTPSALLAVLVFVTGARPQARRRHRHALERRTVGMGPRPSRCAALAAFPCRSG